MRQYYPIAVQLPDGAMQIFRLAAYMPTLSHYAVIGGLLGWDEWAHM
jgi:hypothetical protein